jgi:16S rRNA A1518/A1519 N6-dimethyltransferase RsmA/KsgA/DIM1 with predicted DNA glycosylase/AP lyase activity
MLSIAQTKQWDSMMISKNMRFDTNWSDILKLNFGQLLKKEGQRIKVVANLPYQISTPLLFRFIRYEEFFQPSL